MVKESFVLSYKSTKFKDNNWHKFAEFGSWNPSVTVYKNLQKQDGVTDLKIEEVHNGIATIIVQGYANRKTKQEMIIERLEEASHFAKCLDVETKYINLSKAIEIIKEELR